MSPSHEVGQASGLVLEVAGPPDLVKFITTGSLSEPCIHVRKGVGVRRLTRVDRSLILLLLVTSQNRPRPAPGRSVLDPLARGQRPKRRCDCPCPRLDGVWVRVTVIQ